MKFSCIKCHGCLNEFMIIDEVLDNLTLGENDRIFISKMLCDSKEGFDVDGVLFVLEEENFDGRMRIFNKDGSEAGMCGNGIRCVGRYLMEKLNKASVNIKTMKSSYLVTRTSDIFKGVYTDNVVLNDISLKSRDLPMNTPHDEFIDGKINEISIYDKFSAISITNPHLVSVRDKISTHELTEVGSRVSFYKNIFPEGCNVNFVKVLDKDKMFVKTYERGVGITKSCGTGMVASSIIGTICNELVKNKEIKVYNEGGMILTKVENGQNIRVSMTGNATFLYRVAVELEYKTIKISDKVRFTFEEDSYDKFLNEIKKLINSI